MRVLSFVRVQETGQRPSERLMQDMGKLIEEFMAKGVLVDTAGLHPTSEGVRLRNNHGKLSRTDGPFTEAREVIGGYAIFEVASKDEAIALCNRFLEVHGDEWDVECELRQLETM
jgi:hypothetical protein